ncbi:uncharacterized protein Z520_01463 [Fonsecaea multimorphosa CBS 102226]|uniref:ABC multidrug transporter n=1 Tax=Fonsecaea multimorphosa CBS 102226 TaxID=1442371 RepID=A0A0D2J0V4_9EURO|nr:uncharacterized protein Z520_01463 [Fonsecaea multimorphosa CBS 102226]KIY02997.1 hypothetical protein Z520_01463 [Fonsecaea multimorphosa CBS 102226]OAL30827.1 hypothetical protein AYO22_01447 [Fonsecaea multimorphosa]
MSTVEHPALVADGKVASAQVVEETAVTIKEEEKPEKTVRPPISNYWRILSFRSKRDGFALCLSCLCAIGAGTALPLMNIVFGDLVKDFSGYFLPGSTVTESRFKSTVNQNSLYLVYLFLGKFVLTYISTFCFRITGLRISARLRLFYLQSLFAQPIKKLDEVSSGTVANTITASSNIIQISISDKLHSLFMAVALIITAYVIAFRYSPLLTLVASSSMLFIVIVYSITTPFLLKRMAQVEKANAKAASIAGEVFSSIRAVFALGAEKSLTKKYDAAVQESQRYGLAMSPLYGTQVAPGFFAMYSTFALSFWFGLKQYRDGHIANIGTVVTVFFSVLIVMALLGVLATPIIAITKAIGASTEFFSMIDAPKVSYEGVTDPDVSSHDDIEFNNVNFAYPSRPKVQVLKGFNARFRKGKTTALVGPSGSGKSTIVALLERWYELDGNDPDKDEATSTTEKPDNEQERPPENQGLVSIGGRDIRDTKLKWWRSQIGLVQQEPFLFNDTIFRNVACGLNGTPWEKDADAAKQKRVEKACQEAFADEFIRQLPDGYQTRVGESGIKLSGGQRQRLAIARSIIREPSILILDEATSSIDVRGERIVQKALDQVSRNRTTIVIAHRLSTIRKADNIIVMRDGRKMEEGTHASLLAIADGVYAGLVHAQQLEAETAPQTNESIEASELEQLERRDTGVSAKQHEETATKYKDRGFIMSVGRILYEQQQYSMFYVLIVLAAMAAGSAFSLQSWIFAQLMEVFTFTGQRLKERGDFWSLMFFVLALGMAAAYFILGFLSNHISVLVSSVYRREHFSNLLRNPISYYDTEGNSSGSLMARLATDFKLLSELLGLNGAFPLISLFNMTGCIIISFYFGWKLTLVTFFSAMPVVIFAAFIRVKYEIQFEEWNAKVFAHSSQFATEAVGAFRTVTSLTMEDSIIQKYSDLLQEQIRDATRRATHGCLIFALSDSVELCAMALTFWYGGQLLARHEYNIIQFFLIYSAIVQGAQGAGQFLSLSPNIARATAAANRILGSRCIVGDEDANLNGVGTPLPPSEKRTGAKVEFKDVVFKYPTRDSPIYRNLNLSIESGQFVAFVGPSGCGKTTVISLLERFYNPVSGTITFNDRNLKDIEMPSYRRALSLVAQEPKLFDGTIRENLVLGLDDDEDDNEDGKGVTEEDIVRACKDAEIHDFILSLPDGFDTPLGINTQTSLSGGQKQRLCLARALLRNPSLLLLDEATSSLDSQSEKLVQGAIERLVVQRSMTVVAVAHRLATIQKADVIFVFGESEAGRGSRILERGTHKELLSRRGAYWQMCEEQALDR